MIKLLDFGEDVADFGGGENHRQLELGVSADQLQLRRPLALECFFPEELEGTDKLGGRLAGDFLDGLKVDAVLPNFLKGD
jgi:hypothetical protein